MQIGSYNKEVRVRAGTLRRVSKMLYGAYRSCNPTLTLMKASRAIGRELRHRDILDGNLTETEARTILRRVESLVPDLRQTMIRRVTEMLKP